MRWDDLFDDLQAQAEALEAAELDAEVAERTRIEVGQISLRDRLGPMLDSPIKLTCLGAGSVSGTLRRLASEWLLIEQDAGREAVVVLAAVTAVSGVSRLASPPEPPGSLSSRLGLRHVLRTVARDRSSVQIQLIDGSVLDGTLDRVGSDFLELAEHPAGELRRRDGVVGMAAVPLAHLSLVRRDG